MYHIDKTYFENAERAFKDHKAVLGSSEQLGIQKLNWRKPGTGIYGISYLIHGPYLIVTGDCGEAVYQWSQNITFDFVAGCDIGYFHSKCEASDKGRHNVHWDAQLATERFLDALKDRIKDLIEDEQDFADPKTHGLYELHNQYIDRFNDVQPEWHEYDHENLKLLEGINDDYFVKKGMNEALGQLIGTDNLGDAKVELGAYTCSYEEFYQWLAGLDPNGFISLEDFTDFTGFGEKLAPMVFYHLKGIQMAVLQLDEQANAPYGDQNNEK